MLTAGESLLLEGCVYVCTLTRAQPLLPGFSASMTAARGAGAAWPRGRPDGCGRAVPQAQTASLLRWVHHRDPHSPNSAASLLQANVVCVVYDVTKEATIEKVMGPPL